MINKGIVQIIEIIGPAKAGRTEPFLCRGDDNNLYYVKGAHAGRKAQIREWVGSRLATEFGLPVANCVIVELSQELIEILPPEWKKIGCGFAFGSQAVAGVMDVTISHLPGIPVEIQQDVLIFDLWVQNEDRTLTHIDGNPNLLWDASKSELVVIDHNIAFDTQFNELDFFSCHIFREQWNLVYGDWLLRGDYHERMAECLGAVDQIWDQMPDQWLWLGEDHPLDFDKELIYKILTRCNTELFWKVAK